MDMKRYELTVKAAEWLDEHAPGWWQHLPRPQLDGWPRMQGRTDWIVERIYEAGVVQRGGLDEMPVEALIGNYRETDQAWAEAVRHRMDAATVEPDHPGSEPEVMLVRLPDNPTVDTITEILDDLLDGLGAATKGAALWTVEAHTHYNKAVARFISYGRAMERQAAASTDDAVNARRDQESPFVVVNWDHCPACGSDNLDGESVEISHTQAVQRVICTRCGKGWYEWYQASYRVIDSD